MSNEAARQRSGQSNIAIREGVFVDGTWRPSTGDETVTLINPYTEEPFGRTTLGAAEDVDAAVRSAHRAGSEAGWRNSSLDDRVALVEAIRDKLVSRAEELARLASSSMGSPFLTAKGLGMSAELIDMYVDTVSRVRFEYLRMDKTGDTLIVRRPVGVVAAIVPWNAPVRSEVKKVIPALLAGCSVVLKPASETPFGAAALVEISTEVGVPPGVVNLVLGDGTTGDHLVRHPLVRKVAFTGSSATGSKIWSASAQFRATWPKSFPRQWRSNKTMGRSGPMATQLSRGRRCLPDTPATAESAGRRSRNPRSYWPHPRLSDPCRR